MPLRCIDTKSKTDIRAYDLSLESWGALQLENRAARHLRMSCCSSEVILRTSPRGTRFFAHKTVGDCTTAPETEAHLCLKQIAIEVAHAHGWQADVEVAGTTPEGERWKADVLARKGDRQVAIEVQWSPQTREETSSRQERYRRAGIRCLWLLRQSEVPIDRALPAARISGNPNEGFVALIPTGGEVQRVPMQEFLGAVFSNRFRFGVPLGAPATVSIWTGNLFCRFCGAETAILTRVDVSLGPHVYNFSIPDLDAYPDLYLEIQHHLPDDLGIGAIKRRFSKTQERPYLSNGCTHCDTLIGQFHEHGAWDDQKVVCELPIRITERWRQALNGTNDGTGWGVYLQAVG